MLHDHLVVIFGAAGDLARRKLLPALASLHQQQRLPERFAILGVGRTPLTDVSFRQEMGLALQAAQLPGAAPNDLLTHLYYEAIDTGDALAYRQVATRIADLCKTLAIPRNCLFYLSTPPELAAKIPDHLAACGLNASNDGWKRLIIEKPFGRDLASARALNRALLAHWDEDQIYRIDHYLGKETVQNLLALRFANAIFCPLWNRRRIEYVEITSAESRGVDRRAGYFEQSGAIRDMVQNHMLQLLAMVAIDPPADFDAHCVRFETLKIFQSLQPLREADLARAVVLGQYGASSVRGEALAAYRAEAGVAADSRIDTYAALCIHLDHPRWRGVPFYLRVGKRLPARVAEIVIHFRPTPQPTFFGNDCATSSHANHLIIRIQPDEGILLNFGLKMPGAGFHVKPVNMGFHYADLAEARLPDSYERLLLDCISGDATLYALGEAIEHCWSFVDPISAWRESGEAPLYSYPAGTWGPHAAEALMKDGGHAWRAPCRNLASDGDYCVL